MASPSHSRRKTSRLVDDSTLPHESRHPLLHLPQAASKRDYAGPGVGVRGMAAGGCPCARAVAPRRIDGGVLDLPALATPPWCEPQWTAAPVSALPSRDLSMTPCCSISSRGFAVFVLGIRIFHG
ncbi:hypothetical protein HU200_056136 [Digitaria exilis]|uniref:Uncharacterized protein n=1 Tax=Digitaria exilis TaxID=1010633 RepID=A0A835AED8_9POAL|nr:hypothetical protein HU200_056136 [Digitaria exilis]